MAGGPYLKPGHLDVGDKLLAPAPHHQRLRTRSMPRSSAAIGGPAGNAQSGAGAAGLRSPCLCDITLRGPQGALGLPPPAARTAGPPTIAAAPSGALRALGLSVRPHHSSE